MSSSFITPNGVQGMIPPVPVDRRPTLTGWNPSTSFEGRIARSTSPVSICLGSGTWHEDAVDFGIGVEPRDQRQQRVLRGSLGQPVLEAADADFLGLLELAADIDLARRIAADEHHREAGAGHARGDHRIDLRLGFFVELAGDCAPVDNVGHRGIKDLSSWRA